MQAPGNKGLKNLLISLPGALFLGAQESMLAARKKAHPQC
jgi:hypothetical protein